MCHPEKVVLKFGGSVTVQQRFAKKHPQLFKFVLLLAFILQATVLVLVYRLERQYFAYILYLLLFMDLPILLVLRGSRGR